MRLIVRHRLSYSFRDPTRNVTRILRLTPRSFEGQYVVAWQIDVDTDCVLKAGEDGFGNVTHTFTAKGPVEKLSITVFGEIENFDAAGIVRGCAERLPVELFLRETPLTLAGDELRGFASDAAHAHASPLAKLHALMGAVHETVAFAADQPEASDTALVFAARRGGGHDLAHVFTACARHLGFPARAVSGYHLLPDQKSGIGHAWSEVFVDGLGWTGFDAAHDVCPQESHVRLAAGLDCLAAAPVRGSGDEGVEEDLAMHAAFASEWGQEQRQGKGWQVQSQGGQRQSQG